MNKTLEDFKQDAKEFNLTQYKSVTFIIFLTYTFAPFVAVVWILFDVDSISQERFDQLNDIILAISLYGLAPLLALASIIDAITLLKKRSKK